MNLPMSPATLESSPLNTTSQSANSDALHSLTTSSPASPMGDACFHCTASLYFLPADRDEAPTAWSLMYGWSLRRRMKRWPTEPVHPRTPASVSSCPCFSGPGHGGLRSGGDAGRGAYRTLA